jgi:hypothetical protein
MRVGWVHSMESRKCCGCGSKTGQRKSYQQTEITIEIPLCDECYPKVDVVRSCRNILQRLNKEVKACCANSRP